MRKLYCYVDENGLETKGRIFIVAVIAFSGDAQAIADACEALERSTGKGKTKWGKADSNRRLDYLLHAFKLPTLHGHLCYAIFHDTQDYESSTLNSIARTIQYHSKTEPYKAVIDIDGLSKSKRHVYGARLRKIGISTHKVQGVTKDENNPLVRLADAVAGFVRDALDGQHAEIITLLQQAKTSGALIEV